MATGEVAIETEFRLLFDRIVDCDGALQMPKNPTSAA
jgi:hypothetical protein